MTKIPPYSPAVRERGLRAGLTSREQEGLRRSNVRCGSCARPTGPTQGQRVFCPGGARPAVQAMKAFIDEHRDVYGGRADLPRSADRPINLL